MNMKRCVLAIALWFTSTAHATPPDPTTQQQVEALVTAKLLQPLAKRDDERSRFSRARMPPAERRVRVLAVEVDAEGASFVRFAIDARGGLKQTWQPNTILGCAYLGRAAVFVDRTATGIGTRASDVRDASVLLGKKVERAPAHTCVGR